MEKRKQGEVTSRKQLGGKDEGKRTRRGDKQRGEYEVGRKDKGQIKGKQGHEERRQDEPIREEL